MEKRDIVINKLGTLMLANAELAAENVAILKREVEHLKHIEMLKAELKRWQETANQKELERAAAVGRPEDGGDDLPANPYESSKVH
jgi:hypothetical protein